MRIARLCSTGSVSVLLPRRCLADKAYILYSLPLLFPDLVHGAWIPPVPVWPIWSDQALDPLESFSLKFYVGLLFVVYCECSTITVFTGNRF